MRLQTGRGAAKIAALLTRIEANGPFAIVERPIPEPGPGQVRIRVQACGVCHSDVITKMGGIPGIKFPIVPGHEIAGVIDALGAGVPGPPIAQWRVGQRVGVGWQGGKMPHLHRMPARRFCQLPQPENRRNQL